VICRARSFRLDTRLDDNRAQHLPRLGRELDTEEREIVRFRKVDLNIVPGRIHVDRYMA